LETLGSLLVRLAEKVEVNAPYRDQKRTGEFPSKAKNQILKNTTRKFWQVARTLVRVDVCVNTKICIVIVKNFHSYREEPGMDLQMRRGNKFPAAK
jgi:hypothetical protein